jgi:hypothetical protein
MPPAPPGVDPIRWAYADDRERKRMVRLAWGEVVADGYPAQRSTSLTNPT